MAEVSSRNRSIGENMATMLLVIVGLAIFLSGVALIGYLAGVVRDAWGWLL
jgi:hypothetical protein